jgi:hypothetical protein
MSVVDLADFEGSKENILPLRGGRDPAMLSEAIRDPRATEQKKLAEKQ